MDSTTGWRRAITVGAIVAVFGGVAFASIAAGQQDAPPATDPPVIVSPPIGVLELHQAAPAAVLAGSRVTWDLTLSNTGAGDLVNVVVTDVSSARVLPDALPQEWERTSSGTIWRVPRLAGGQSASTDLPTQVGRDTRGKVCNTATARAVGAGPVRVKACTVVVVGRRPTTPVRPVPVTG